MSQEATIRRGVRNARYAAIPNHVFEDARLSMEARWLLSYLLSKPDNWTVVIGDIIKKGNCGRDKARKMIAELVDLGYAEREQIRDDGKFGSSILVIYDEPSVGIHSENQAVGEGVAFLPQTCLPATAEPSPVLPAPVKSAPSNNSDLTITENQNLREGARDDLEEEESARALERRFRKWWATWPSYAVDSEAATRREWLALTPQQRRDCEERTPAYLTSIKSLGRKFSKAAATYLSERAWERIGDVATGPTAPSLHKAFSRAWQGLRLAQLLGPEAPLPRLTSFLQGVVLQRSTPEECNRGDGILRDHRARYAWPKVTDMHNGYRPVQVPAEIVGASEGFKAYHVGSPTVAAWKRLHERRGWPWPEMGNAEWICFPEADGDSDEAIEAALIEFSDRIGKGQGDEHAA